jgi:hypothetical protein
VPHSLEKDYHYLVVLENLLNTQEFDERWWAPMRQGQLLRLPPIDALVDFIGDRCDISFRFAW